MSMAPVYLTEEERVAIEKFAKNGTHNSHLIVRANILLVLDRTGKKDHMRIKRTAEEHGASRQTVYDIIEDYHDSKDITEFLSRKVRETPPTPSAEPSMAESGSDMRSHNCKPSIHPRLPAASIYLSLWKRLYFCLPEVRPPPEKTPL